MSGRSRVLAVCLGLCSVVAAQQRVAEYERMRTKALAEASQRHLELGSWARDQGLVPQATGQFLRAVEIGEGKNPGAATVLGAMRGLGDAFWTQRKKKPTKALLAEFDRRAALAEKGNRKDHLELAHRATLAERSEQARGHYRKVLELGGELARDDKGFTIEGQRIPADLATWLEGESRADQKGRPVFEAAGNAAPKLAGLVVHEDALLQVRTDLPGDAAAKLHALGSALLPHLRERLDGAPTQRLVLTVFARHADYVAYLTARGMAGHAKAPGLCDYGTFQTLVAATRADGAPLGDGELHALVLHELAHLYFFGVAPAVMPDWYAEGFAESFGGQGTFTWDGTRLTVGGRMDASRLESLRAAPLSLRELVDVRIGVLLAMDRKKGIDYYAQCWALQRFLRQPECKWHDRFAQFEAACRGKALGAPERGRPAPDAAPASVEFLRLFGADLDAIDAAFREWLAKS
ncbi:MAG: hypothetical protein JNK15_03685 [Planctomycetes bacterium]|nr:hypothetical protein [Planctomycetota bacterium]